MGKLNVLMLNRSFSLTGGVPRVLLTYGRNYDHGRVQLHIASFRPFAPAMADAVRQTGTTIHQLGDRGYLKPAFALRKILKEHAIDVVVATSLKSYLVAKLASTRRCRVAYWIHGIALILENPIKLGVYRWAARRDTLIFIAEIVKAAHNYPGHTGRAEVVLNGVEDFLSSSSLYGQHEREEMGISPSAFVVGCTAAFIPLKEHKTLLAAFSRLAPDYPDLHIILIGTGDLFESIQAHARTIPDGERIHFLGPRPDARQLLGLMDVYVQPSNGEGISIAIIEAMLAQRAIVVSNAGALPEMIDDGDTGLTFRVLDPDDLAQKIATLARDPQLRRRLGERARQVALDRFGASRFAERITAILETEPGIPDRASKSQ